MALIEQLTPGPAPVVVPRSTSAPRAARCASRSPASSASSRRACLDACPRLTPAPPLRVARAGPRLLSLGELERVRDELAGRLARVRDDLDAQLLRQAESRALLERMFADPPAYKWMRVSNAQLGEPGCKHFHVRPRLGPVGLLAGLVAREGLLRLPVSLGAVTAVTAPPDPSEWASAPASAAAAAAARRAAPPRGARARRAAAAAARRSRTARSRRGTRSRSSSCACSSGSCCSCSARSTCARDRGKLLLVLGMALGSLGGLDTALREHLAGYRSHTTVIAVAAGGARPPPPLYFAGAPVAGRRGRGAVGVFGGRVLVDAPGLHAPREPRAPGARLASTPCRTRSACSCAACTTSRRSAATLDATIAFYRDLLGLAVVHDGPSDDDPDVAPRVVRRARRRARAGS